ncbi:MAG: DUF1553 domain-containing protein [Gemmataceae bacterium]|nr:DUF1553 domain-containing protein [Gemmataceae bacterium]
MSNRIFLGLCLLCTPVQAQKVEPVTEKPIRPADRAHWSFQPPKRSKVPNIRLGSWVRNPVDAFILARLEAFGLVPAAPAERLALLRRVHIDLVGISPSPEEQEAFLTDSSPDAYEKVVDRLLTSPHYGERWAQRWFDAIRYAESNGYEADGDRPNAWRYRDFVVRSFNDNKPFDRFLIEQLAGDELAAGKDLRAAAELWIATGIHRAGPVHLVSGNSDPEILRQEVLTEYVQGVSSAVLGLTVNCARCHDHKFDPVSQADYYRLEAFFAATRFKEIDFATAEEKKAYQTEVSALNEKIKPFRSQIEAIDAKYRPGIREAKRLKLEPIFREAHDTDVKKRTKEQAQLVKESEVLLKVTWDEVVAALSPEDRLRRGALRAQMHELQAKMPAPPPGAWAIGNDEKIPPTYILRRGEVKRKGGTVEPDFPRILEPGDPGKEPSVRRNRIDLAKWITRPDHPLSARVFVNRVWQHHFGRGIVGTPNDFGLRGEKPTHPELLDWLATEFVASGWKIKDLHRLIVLSNTYRQSERVRNEELGVKSKEPTPHSKDPENRLLWKMPRRRLEGESLRDAMLAASGTLNRQVGGPSVRVPLEPEVYDLLFTEGEPDGLWHVTPDVSQHNRRSLYLLAKRNVRLPMLEAFDQPDSLTPCAARAVSTFAPQALILMNGPFAQEQSRAMAASVIREAGNEPEKQIALAYRRAFCRAPTVEEVRLAREFLDGQVGLVQERFLARLPAGVPERLPKDADVAQAVALADFCLALFNANEFVYMP